MRTEEKLRKILVDWKEFETPELIEREFDYDYLDSDKILTITGPRRAGKTYLCFQLHDRLLEQGINPDNILYINFEDERLHPLKGDELTKLLDIYYELFEPEQGKIYFFLDEIHEIPDWELWARRISEQKKKLKLILTGSSSKLLPKELSTKLRGRSLNKSVYPFSFKELVKLKGLKFDLDKIAYSKKKAEIKKLFNTYLRYGGFPEVVREENKQIKQEILRGYYSTIFERDLVERFGVNNIEALQDFLKIRMDNFARPMTYTKSRNNLKSLGHKVGKSTLKRYLSHANHVFLLFDLKKYSPKVKSQMRYPRKIYPIDTGLVNSIRFDFSEDRGRALETIVFLDLKRREKEVYYYRNKGECDFLVKEGQKITQAIQVTESLENNKEREIEGLIEAAEDHNLSEALILTEDRKDKIVKKNIEIEILPIWLWLLRD